MSNQPRITMEEIGGDFGFVLKWEREARWMGVTAFRIVDIKGDKKMFAAASIAGSARDTHDIAKAKEYLSGCVKLGGAADLNLGGASLSFSGPNEIKHHMALLKYIYLRAFELMGREPEQPWADKKLPEMQSGSSANSE